MKCILSRSTLITAIVLFIDSRQTFAQEERPSARIELPLLTVVSPAPLPGTTIPIEKFSGNIQIIGSEKFTNQNPVDLTEILFKNIGSIDINSAQTNPSSGT